MNPTADLQTLTQQLADVEPPGPPQWWPWYLLAIVLLAVVATAAQLAWRAYRRRGTAAKPASANALAKLQTLHGQWRSGQLNDRQTAFRLATLLRLGLGLDQLTPEKPAALKEDEQQWRTTIALLGKLRYRPHPMDQLDEAVFRQIRCWLEHDGESPC